MRRLRRQKCMARRFAPRVLRRDTSTEKKQDGVLLYEISPPEARCSGRGSKRYLGPERAAISGRHRGSVLCSKMSGWRRQGDAQMKLQDLEIFVVAPPAPGWGGRYWIFPKLTTDTRHHRLRRMLCLDRRTRGDEGGHRGRVPAPHGRREPREYRDDVPPRLFLRLHPAPRPHRDGRVFGARDRLLGHPRQGPRPPGLGAVWAA